MDTSQECQEQFLILNSALIDKQEFEITYAVPAMVRTEKPPNGVDEPVIFPNETWWASSVGDAFKRALDTHAELGHGKLIGFLHPEYKAPSRVQVLW